MTRAEKEAFLKRMAAGRRKAAKKNGAGARKKKNKAAKAKPAKKAAKKKNKSRAKRPNVTKPKTRAYNPPSKKRNPKKKKNRRRNQEGGSIEEAARQFESFHGKAPGKVREYDLSMRYPEHFAELGELKELRIYLDEMNPEFVIKGFGGTQLVSTPDGSNLYLIGGDQSIDMAAMGIASDKDLVELGPCVYISYFTVKGFHDFEPTTYWHEFGEEDDIYPVLAYDRLNKNLFLLGGNYRVRPEGITN